MLPRGFSSDNVSLGDVEWVVGRADDLLDVDDLGFLVDDGILDMDVLADDGVTADDGVLDHGPAMDADATAEDGVDDRAFDDGTVGDIGIGGAAALLVEDRGRIVGLGVDGPFLVKEGGIGLFVKKVEGILQVVAQRIEGLDIAIVADGTDEDGGRDVVEGIGKGEEGRGSLGILHEALQHRIVHDHGTHGDIAFVRLAAVCLDAGDLAPFGDVDLAGTDKGILQSLPVRIEKGDAGTGSDMVGKKGLEIRTEDHVGRGDDDIVGLDGAQEPAVLEEIGDVGVVSGIGDVGLIVENLELADLGVVDPGVSVSDMAGEGTDVVLAEDADRRDAGVEAVGKLEVDEGISSQEGGGSDGTMLRHRPELGAVEAVDQT